MMTVTSLGRLENLRTFNPDLKDVLLTHSEAARINRALAYGIDACVKEQDPEALAGLKQRHKPEG
jgi:hypothetical protein